ncbi:hypothetical protein ACQZV8_08890 [Magnetococcales bacterium HHB-1]
MKSKFHLFTLSLFFLFATGCDQVQEMVGELTGEGKSKAQDILNTQDSNKKEESEGLFGDLQKKMDAGKEALGVAGEVLDKQPDVLGVIKGEKSLESVKENLNKDYLLEKANQLKGIANSAGLSPENLGEAEKAMARKAGEMMNVSQERMNSLEQKFEQNKEKLIEKYDALGN